MTLLRYNLTHNLTRVKKWLPLFNKTVYDYTFVDGKVFQIRKNSTDYLVFKKVFIDMEYNFSFKHTIDYVIDAGANIGASAVYLALKFPNAKIIAVEPEANNFEQLKNNVSFYPNIIPLLGGVWSERGAYKIKNEKGDSWNFMLEKSDDEISNSRLYTIDELMDIYELPRIDFLKIDIEGAESVLFEKNYHWLSVVKSLSIEFHDFIIPNSSNAFFKALVQYEPFSFITLGENHLITLGN
jgi:FkbM family methyltransferase